MSRHGRDFIWKQTDRVDGRLCCAWSFSCIRDSLRPHGLYSLPESSVRGVLQAIILEWVAMPSSRGSSQAGIKPRSLALQVAPFTVWAAGKAHSRLVPQNEYLAGSQILFWIRDGGGRDKETSQRWVNPCGCPLEWQAPGRGTDVLVSRPYSHFTGGQAQVISLRPVCMPAIAKLQDEG